MIGGNRTLPFSFLFIDFDRDLLCRVAVALAVCMRPSGGGGMLQ